MGRRSTRGGRRTHVANGRPSTGTRAATIGRRLSGWSGAGLRLRGGPSETTQEESLATNEIRSLANAFFLHTTLDRVSCSSPRRNPLCFCAPRKLSCHANKNTAMGNSTLPASLGGMSGGGSSGMKTPEYSSGAMRYRRAEAAWNASRGSRE
eukprot:scaffold236872_cov33-Tisochrysis_lutea.AAC.3